MLKGCDISKFQGNVNFDSLKSAVDFVVIRSSYGVGFRDTQFDRNRSEAKRVGLAHGYYHYAYPNLNTPENEADWFLSCIGTPDNGEFLCLDFEESFDDPVGWSKRFLDHLSARLTGYKGLLYANLALITSKDFSPIVSGNYGLWLAYWDYKPTAPAPKTAWPFVAMRQWSNRESIAGIANVVDADTFYGDFATLQAYGYHAPVVVPTPTPIPDQEKVDMGTDPQTGEVYGILEVQAVRSLLWDRSRALKDCQNAPQPPVVPPESPPTAPPASLWQMLRDWLFPHG